MSLTTFRVTTDAHIGPAATGHGADRKLTARAPETLRGILNEAQRLHSATFGIDLGDPIEHTSDGGSHAQRAQTDTRNFARALEIFKEFQIPTHHCIGNHPLMAASEEMLLRALNRESPHYSFNVGGHHIVMLHSQVRHRATTATHRSGSGIHIDEGQLAWLKQDLRSTERPTLVCCHHPLVDQDLTGNVWFNHFPECALTQNRVQVQEILAESQKVVAVLSGHTHWNYLTTDRHGTPHITLQSLSENFRNDGTSAATYAIGALQGSKFNLEIFGKDLMMSNRPNSSAEIARSLADTYTRIAPVYADRTAQYGAPEREQFDRLLTKLHPNHTRRVVDFGCGQGRDVAHYARQGYSTIGVDASEGLIQIAKRLNPEADFIAADFAAADIPPNSAAIVIHNSSLQHVPKSELVRVLKKAYDVLEPGGVFYAHYRSGEGESLSISTEYDTPIARFIALYTEQEMEEALREAGFVEISSDTFDHQYSGLKGETVKYKTRTWAIKPWM